MKLTGTFLDEITHDVPSLNYDENQWDRDFSCMKMIGINKVIMIRCGHKNFMTFPSKVLQERENAFQPPIDLVEMFLRLAEKHEMKFFFGTYSSGRDWLLTSYDPACESDIMSSVCDEVWEHYGKYSKAFGGWYLSQEISSAISFNVVKCYQQVGRHCKSISGNLPILISPGIDGPKTAAYRPHKLNPITPEKHSEDWDWILGEIEGIVDYVAFQDGHVNYEDLESFLAINKKLADKHHMTLWTNAETFERDIPGWMPPIKWEKLQLKLDAAKRVGIQEGITFDFSHFLSPYSCYSTAANLLRKYCQWAGIEQLAGNK